jgi:hypothetical protein
VGEGSKEGSDSAKSEIMTLDWVVRRVKFFCHVVGLSCEIFEEQLLVLFAALEASRNQNNMVNNSTFFSS